MPSRALLSNTFGALPAGVRQGRRHFCACNFARQACVYRDTSNTPLHTVLNLSPMPKQQTQTSMVTHHSACHWSMRMRVVLACLTLVPVTASARKGSQTARSSAGKSCKMQRAYVWVYISVVGLFPIAGPVTRFTFSIPNTTCVISTVPSL